MPLPLNLCKSRLTRISMIWARSKNLRHLTRFSFIRTKDLGEHAPETADLYFSYGKALLENAIAQSSVLGKEQEQAEEAVDEQAKGACVVGCLLWLLITKWTQF